MDRRGAVERIVIAGRPLLSGPHLPGDFAAHPAVFLLDDKERSHYAAQPEIAFASWVLEDGALDAVIAAGVDAEYARAAHRAGVTDAWDIIDGWEAGIPVEFLSAMGGAA